MALDELERIQCAPDDGLPAGHVENVPHDEPATQQSLGALASGGSPWREPWYEAMHPRKQGRKVRHG